MRTLRTDGKLNGQLHIAGVAVESERAARKAYAAKELHFTDAAGNVVGMVRFWGGQFDLTIDPRINVSVRKSTYWPEEQTDDNNDAQIMARAHAVAEKAKADHEGVSDEQALADALGIDGTWEYEQLQKGQVGGYYSNKYKFAER